MTLVAGLLAQILHIGLVAAAAPSLLGIVAWLQGRLAGRAGPPLMQPWWELTKLLRKQTVLAESASALAEDGPVVGAAATAIAAGLVPSFALGMCFARFADLLVITGLLAVARCSLALTAMDAGTALAGVGAARSALLACLAEPARLMVLLVLALAAGSLNVDLIAAMQIESAIGWKVGVGLAFAASLLVALVDTIHHDAVAEDIGGPSFALIGASDALRLLVWCNLIGAMFLPFGMASAGAGPIAWAEGFICWLARTLLFAIALAVLHAGLGVIGMRRASRMLGVAMMFGLLGAVFLCAEVART
jgi:formate hydrogenlyase subunit 4